MGVQPHAHGPGQHCRLLQQVCGNAEGRARGQRHLVHGKSGRVVELFHQPLAVLQDGIHILNQVIRRQTSVAPSPGHAAPGGMEPDAQLIRCPKLLVDEVLRTHLGKHIMMVHAGGAAIFQQLPQPHQGAVVDAVLVQSPPDLIQRPQPRKQLHFLHLRQVPGKGLIQVMVGVHQARIYKTVGCVDNAVRRTFRRPDIADDVVLHQDIPVPQHPVLPVHGNNGLGIADQCSRHRSRSFLIKNGGALRAPPWMLPFFTDRSRPRWGCRRPETRRCQCAWWWRRPH